MAALNPLGAAAASKFQAPSLAHPSTSRNLEKRAIAREFAPRLWTGGPFADNEARDLNFQASSGGRAEEGTAGICFPYIYPGVETPDLPAEPTTPFTMTDGRKANTCPRRATGAGLLPHTTTAGDLADPRLQCRDHEGEYSACHLAGPLSFREGPQVRRHRLAGGQRRLGREKTTVPSRTAFTEKKAVGMPS